MARHPLYMYPSCAVSALRCQRLYVICGPYTTALVCYMSALRCQVLGVLRSLPRFPAPLPLQRRWSAATKAAVCDLGGLVEVLGGE
eukprot:988050-Rhodomonas_salina.1